MDLDKLKVAELRTELSGRGLDTKGTKPVLLARLREAILKQNNAQDHGEPSPEPEMVEAEQVEAIEPEPAAVVASSETATVEAAKDEEGDDNDDDDQEEEAKEEDEPMDHATGTNGEAASDEKKEDETMAVKTDEKKSPEKTEDEAKKPQDKEDEGKAANNKQRRGQKRKMDDEPFVVNEDEPEIDESITCLDWYNSDMNLKITKEDMMTAEPFWKDGWGYVWAGVRSTYGFTEGQITFEVKLLEHMDSKLENEKNLHELRIGFSTDEPSLQLGESKNSFCYSGSGKKGHDSVFEDFGATFTKDDVVGAYLEFADDQVKISFTKNGESQGEAFDVPQSELEGKALFPHISTRNVKFEVNFGKTFKGEDREAWKPTLEGYEMAANVEIKVRGPSRIAKREDCEMLMMIGLPASGKTTWVKKHVEEHPEKRYNIIGTAALIEKMKVNGEPRKQHHEKDKWDALIQKCTRCLQDWLRVASQRRRNIVIDQTNVYANAQKRKVRPFEGMLRKAVVIVPSEEDYKARGDSQEKAECKDVPDTAVMEMKANFTVPAEGEDSPFKEIVFTDLQREEATKLVETYNKDAKEKGYGKKHEQRNKRFRGNFNKNRGGRMARGGGRGMPPGRMPPFFRGGMRGMPPRGFPMRPPMRGGMGGPMRGGPPHRWGPPQGMPMGGPPRGGGNMPGPRGGGPRGGRGNMAPRGNMGGPRNNMGPRGGGGGGGHGGPQKFGGGGGSAPWGNPAPWSQSQRPAGGPWGNAGGGGGGGPWSQGGGNQMGGGSPWGNQGGMNQPQRGGGMMGGYGSRPTSNVWGGNQGGGGGGNFNQGGFGGGGGGGGGNNAWGGGFGGGYGGGYGR